MKQEIKRSILVLLACASTGAALADEDQSLAVGLRAGTTGLGIDLVYPLTDTLNLRGGLTRFTAEKELTENDIDYRAKVEVATVGVYADWHPFSGGFRLSTGLVRNGSEFNLTAKPSAGATYTFNGVAYDISDIGSATGKVAFSPAPSPYFGLGFGNATSGSAFGVFIDLGVIWQHAPTSELNVVCSESLASSSPETCLKLKADAKAEQLKLDDKLKEFRWYPVVAVGLTYRF